MGRCHFPIPLTHSSISLFGRLKLVTDLLFSCNRSSNIINIFHILIITFISDVTEIDRWSRWFVSLLSDSNKELAINQFTQSLHC